MRPAEKFEAALDATRAAWEAERKASAAKIQALLSEGLQMMRERDQARREAAVWRDAYQRATGTEPDTITIGAGTLLGSVAGR